MIDHQRAAWRPEDIIWDEELPDGTKSALLEGARQIPGESFTYAFFIPPGFYDPPHWHTADARVAVVMGSLRLGYGDQLEPTQLNDYPIGSYLLVPAGDRHFDGADEPTMIIGTAVGPWSTHYCD